MYYLCCYVDFGELILICDFFLGEMVMIVVEVLLLSFCCMCNCLGVMVDVVIGDGVGWMLLIFFVKNVGVVEWCFKDLVVGC